MPQLIDLTHSFTDNMPVFPGSPCARMYQICFHEKEGLVNHVIETDLHVGTHMDAPFHMLEKGALITDIPLENFTGRGVFVDGRGKDVVDADVLGGISLMQGDIVLVYTGWDKRFRDDDYYVSYPELSPAFARKLVEAKVHAVCLDTPSPDREPFEIHKILLGSDVLIIENGTNFESLQTISNFRIHAYPNKMEAEAAPLRLVAEVL